MIRILLSLALLLASLPANAIVIRHDREDAFYRSLAAQFPMVCEVGGGTGTLINPHWVLTAAHVAESFPRKGGHVTFGQRRVEVESVHIHPRYADGADHRDLALLKLATAVEDIEAATLYRTQNEAGQTVTFVGNGYTGNGNDGPSPGERVWRAAHNTAERVEPNWVVFHFDAPPAGDALEGISGPGDSGGPAFVETDDGLAVLGVSAYNDGTVQCTYGSNEFYGRVSTELEWLESVMRGEETPREPQVLRYDENEQGQATVQREKLEMVPLKQSDDARLWSVVGSLVGAVHDDAREDYVALFDSAYTAKREEAGDSVVSMFDFLRQVRTARGDIKTFHPLAREGVQIPDSSSPMRPVTFHLADGMAGYFGIALDQNGLIDHLSLFVREGICEEGSACSRARPLKSARKEH